MAELSIIVNGEARKVANGATVLDLLAELGFANRPVAVECNRTVVPKAQHGTKTIAEGDRLELVTFVGGG